MALSPVRGAVVFDLDGVLADSFKDLYALNADAMRFIGCTLTPETYRALFLSNIHASLRRLIRRKSALRRFAEFKRANFPFYYKRTRLFRFSHGLIRRLRGSFALGIVSSTPRDHIRRLLNRHRLRNCFSAILGSEAVSKERELVQAVRLLRSPRAQTFFVTDTAGDIRLGKRIGLRTLAVAWGFHPKATLMREGPEKLFSDSGALLRHLSWSKTIS